MLIFDDNIVHLDSCVTSIMWHLIKACQGRQHKEILKNELNWAKYQLDDIVNKVNDENTQIAYSEEERKKLMSVYEHSREQMYL